MRSNGIDLFHKKQNWILYKRIFLTFAFYDQVLRIIPGYKILFEKELPSNKITFPFRTIENDLPCKSLLSFNPPWIPAPIEITQCYKFRIYYLGSSRSSSGIWSGDYSFFNNSSLPARPEFYGTINRAGISPDLSDSLVEPGVSNAHGLADIP